MSFASFKLFKDIAAHKSLTKAAALNGISTSAASQQIQELERTVQAALLDRTTRPLQVTPAGQLYFDMCRDILRRKEQFDAALGVLKHRVAGTVRVASIYSVGLSEMSRLEGQFAGRFPIAELKVAYLRPEKIYEALLADEADLGLVSYPEGTKHVAVIPWREEEMGVAASPSHPLAGRYVVAPSDLVGQNFVAFDAELPIRHEVDRYLRDNGAEVDITMSFDNIPMIKEAIALGSAISILPLRILKTEIEKGQIVSLPILPRLFRPLGIIHLKKKKFNRATQAFLDLLQEKPALYSETGALARTGPPGPAF